MAECSVCCEKINLQNHKKVNCPFCDFTSCRTCVQTYLLSISIDPHCMQCKNLWSREVIDDSCTKSFRNTKLKVHRENILFEREKCLMPDTQPFVAQVIQSRKIAKEITEIYEKISEFNEHIRSLERVKQRLDGGEIAPTAEKREFIRKCPVSECKGFLSSRWKCQICENNICQHCNEKDEGDQHTCDPGNVETVALLKKDTKPCPKCGTMIFKISGCAQMWCPDCHTAFDWNTMKIELGRIHNPHYYEFKKGQSANPAREQGDIPCGGLPDMHEIVKYKKMEPVYHIYAIHRLASHILYNEIPHLGLDRNQELENRQLRVKYMLNEFSEEIVKTVLQKNEKAREKRRDILNVIRMFSDVLCDFMRQLVVGQLDIMDFYENAQNLRHYANNSFENIFKRYNCSTPYISLEWNYSNHHKFTLHRPQPQPIVVV